MKRIALLTARAVALALLFTPGLFAAYLAMRPDYDGTLGLLLGLTLFFWAGASFIGWVLTIVLFRNSRSFWARTILGSFSALLANASALGTLDGWNSVKRDRYFSAHQTELATIGDELIAGRTDIVTARAKCKLKGILMVPMRLVRTPNCCLAVFYAYGALDSQIGYYYRGQQSGSCTDFRKRQKIDESWQLGPI
jgi:hypothetical protein